MRPVRPPPRRLRSPPRSPSGRGHARPDRRPPRAFSPYAPPPEQQPCNRRARDLVLQSRALTSNLSASSVIDMTVGRDSVEVRTLARVAPLGNIVAPHLRVQRGPAKAKHCGRRLLVPPR